MRHYGPRTVLFAAILLNAGPVEAQEFRVYTRIVDETAEAANRSRETQRPAVISRSLTVSHAGKVYDWLDEVGEVIIFEPAHRRFTILNTQKSLATRVNFDQLHHLLKEARGGLKQYLADPPADGSPSAALAAMLRFQLDPDFEETFDRERKRLVLESPHLRYQVRWAEVEAAEIADTYLRYADWMCRLNYVLHPRALLPSARLALNDRLRRRGVIPAEVRLHADFQPPLQLRAEHQFHWDLETNDRLLINRWERMLERDETRPVTFPEYQRVMLQKDVAQQR